MAFNKSTAPFKQERLAKDDIRLLIQFIEMIRNPAGSYPEISVTRVDLLLGKLKRMEKQ